MHLPVGRAFVRGGIETDEVFGSSCCRASCFVSVETHVSDAIDILPRRLMCQSPNHRRFRLWKVRELPVLVMRHLNLGLRL